MIETTTLLHTERLALHLMTPTFLEASLAGEPTKAAQLLGITICHVV